MTSTAATVSVTMPKLGESVVEGTVVRWLKQEGDSIAKYEPLVEVITDKVNTEIPSPAGGIVARLTVAEGQTVAVGVEIAVISAVDAASGVSAPPEPVAPVASAAPETAPAEDDEPGQDVEQPNQRSSPLVRRLAKEHGIDVSQIEGTGTGGRVRKEDILAFIEQQGVEPAASPMARDSESGADEEALPLTPVRRAIAEHMVRSLRTAPHTWTYVECDVSGLVKWRAAEREAFKVREGIDLTYVSFVCKALVETLREHPILNSTWREGGAGGAGGQVVLKKRINLGVAVGLEENLVVPVIRDADRLTVSGLAHALHDLLTRARNNQLRPADVQGGTFTLNNTGALGSILSQPIINQPQAAILTMEAIVKRVVVTQDDAIAVRPIMNVCISFDHRVCDGLQVGRFMQSLKCRIEGLAPGGSLY